MKCLPITKILLVLLLGCEELLKAAPKITVFLLYPPLACEKLHTISNQIKSNESNPIPYPEYLHLSISAFLLI